MNYERTGIALAKAAVGVGGLDCYLPCFIACFACLDRCTF
uniref:Uncharacterized protein n=1 Tax=Rhizophora mucronata TaxID=61149 RepID=A0A2P2JJB2_RHIMU